MQRKLERRRLAASNASCTYFTTTGRAAGFAAEACGADEACGATEAGGAAEAGGVGEAGEVRVTGEACDGLMCANVRKSVAPLPPEDETQTHTSLSGSAACERLGGTRGFECRRHTWRHIDGGHLCPWRPR